MASPRSLAVINVFKNSRTTLLMIGTVCIIILTASADTGIMKDYSQRESKQWFPIPYGFRGYPMRAFGILPIAEPRPVFQEKAVDERTSEDVDVSGRQYFGITNIFTGTRDQSQSQNCPNTTCAACEVCKTCDVCPSCMVTPAVSNFEVSVIERGCSYPLIGSDSFPFCTRAFTGEKGSFLVTFDGTFTTLPNIAPTMFIAVTATCPNTEFTFQCVEIAQALVSTQTNPNIPYGKAITENDALHIVITQQATGFSKARCFWTSKTYA